jgi:hypothetical protein
MSTGLDKSIVVPVAELSADELLNVWANHRNDLYGVMAAEEGMRRLNEYRTRSTGSLSALLGVRQVLPTSSTKSS